MDVRQKITLSKYIEGAPPGTYEHAGRYCWLCDVQTAFYRKYKAIGVFFCTVCGTAEGFGPEDLEEAEVLAREEPVRLTSEIVQWDELRTRLSLKVKET